MKNKKIYICTPQNYLFLFNPLIKVQTVQFSFTVRWCSIKGFFMIGIAKAKLGFINNLNGPYWLLPSLLSRFCFADD